jgi:transglutaminase-like putative cysteine protease
MLYDVSLRISHRYDRPAVGARHLLRLTPPSFANEQQRIAASLDISPKPSERAERSDFFGNATIEAAFASAHESLDLMLRARIRRQTAGYGLDLSPPVAELAQEIADHRSLAPDSPHHFLADSPRAPIFRDATDFARKAADGGLSTFETLRAVGEAIHEAMTFEVGATTVDTPVEQAFAKRRGVCQDFSHLMISALRGIGVPAGYVGGFLRTTPPEGQERLQGADAMHAWVRIWCGVDMGWVEYDPTNAMFVADDHIVLARGRDYSDVAPVRGVLRTAGTQASSHAVDVVVVEEK